MKYAASPRALLDQCTSPTGKRSNPHSRRLHLSNRFGSTEQALALLDSRESKARSVSRHGQNVDWPAYSGIERLFLGGFGASTDSVVRVVTTTYRCRRVVVRLVRISFQSCFRRNIVQYRRTKRSDTSSTMIPLEQTLGVIFGWAKNAYRAPVGLILHLAAHLCWETVFVNAIELVPSPYS
jgi:hypothetical protein